MGEGDGRGGLWEGDGWGGLQEEDCRGAESHPNQTFDWPSNTFFNKNFLIGNEINCFKTYLGLPGMLYLDLFLSKSS